MFIESDQGVWKKVAHLIEAMTFCHNNIYIDVLIIILVDYLSVSPQCQLLYVDVAPIDVYGFDELLSLLSNASNSQCVSDFSDFS